MEVVGEDGVGEDLDPAEFRHQPELAPQDFLGRVVEEPLPVHRLRKQHGFPCRVEAEPLPLRGKREPAEAFQKVGCAPRGNGAHTALACGAAGRQSCSGI